MRRGGLVDSALLEVLGRCLSGKGAVGSVVIVEMLEAVEDRVESLDGAGQLVAGIALVSPCARCSVRRRR